MSNKNKKRSNYREELDEDFGYEQESSLDSYKSERERRRQNNLHRRKNKKDYDDYYEDDRYA